MHGGASSVFLMKNYSDSRLINVGTGQEVAIGELARKICAVVGYEGRLIFDTTKPDGMPRKLLDSSRILQLGWRPTIPLDQGLSQTYRWFLDQRELQTVYLRRTRRSNCAPYAKPTSNVPAAETPRIILSAEATSPVTTNEPRLYPM